MCIRDSPNPPDSLLQNPRPCPHPHPHPNPQVVVVSPEGKILNLDAYDDVTAPTNFDIFPWEENEKRTSMVSCAIQCIDQAASKCGTFELKPLRHKFIEPRFGMVLTVSN
eukprot:TRINITY_DN26077_c0_g2_i1.p1 TRINITY_DN26077_c0_g2~~TRINITY_DN26077_c0_g2_i1.p1  ORF type:complete len:110 (-),score=14.25 TRINITY_DN26077_c0_g2_i1:206-535(-)